MGVYKAGLERVRTKPVPKGQKYPPGTRVHIAKDLGPMMSHFTKDKDATVEYTYAHAYPWGKGQTDQYSLNIDGEGSSAWYYEWQLTPI
jgi:hypothetical protein